MTTNPRDGREEKMRRRLKALMFAGLDMGLVGTTAEFLGDAESYDVAS